MNTALWLLAFVAALPIVARADIVISPDPGDSPLVISGWLDEGSGFTGNLRLTAERDTQGSDTAQDVNFQLLASDLKTNDGMLSVGRQNVGLVGNPILRPGVPQDFQIAVNGVTEPGTYQGKIELLPTGQLRTEAVAIDLTVVARVRPSLQPLRSAEKIRLDLVNCDNRVSCGLASFLLPESASLNRWDLQFNNVSATETKLIRSAVGIIGDKTHYSLAGGQLALPKDPLTLPASEISTIPVTLDRAVMPPDHYTGFIYLSLDGAKEMHQVPVDLNVRSGPFWPLLAILFGIVIGRLVKYMQERGAPQAEKLVEINRVTLMLHDAQDEDRKILEPQLEALRQDVYRHNLDSVTTNIEAIEASLEALTKLREMEKALAGKQQDPDAKAAQAKIIEARLQISARQDASALIDEAEQKLGSLKQALMSTGASDPTVDRAVQAASEAKAAAAKAKVAGGGLGETERGRWPRVKAALIGLSGLSAELRAEATLWIVRPLLYFVLLFGLLAIGLETLYVANGLTFGANPFPDYLGLILWGLSSDVAGRTLTNLHGTKGGGQG